MTQNQIKTVLKMFPQVSAGSHNIAESLLKNGEVITTVERLWNGGVGNFIYSYPAEGTVGCYKMVLDKSFFSSLFFREFLENQIAEKNDEIRLKQEQLNNLEKCLEELKQL